jgi:excisionase family DNA binding protein
MHQEMSTVEMALIASTSERTVQRWISEGRLPAEHIEHNRYRIHAEDLEKLKLGKHYEEARGLQRLERKVTDQAEQIAELSAALRIATEQLERLATASLSELETQLHDIRTVYHSKLLEYDPALLKALTARVEALEQRLSTPATTPGTPETATKPKTPRAQPTRSAEAVGKSSELPTDLVSARSFAGKHGIHENTLDKAIKSGRLPVETGRWKDGAFWVQKALNQAGRARFVELYHSNPHFHQCDDPECPCHEQT